MYKFCPSGCFFIRRAALMRFQPLKERQFQRLGHLAQNLPRLARLPLADIIGNAERPGCRRLHLFKPVKLPDQTAKFFRQRRLKEGPMR